jgi:hypothetical protein
MLHYPVVPCVIITVPGLHVIAPELKFIWFVVSSPFILPLLTDKPVLRVHRCGYDIGHLKYLWVQVHLCDRFRQAIDMVYKTSSYYMQLSSMIAVALRKKWQEEVTLAENHAWRTPQQRT